MKKIINIVLIIVTILFLTIITFATGDGNIDSGGSGGTGSGTNQNKWSAGDDGVRVSIINTENQQVVNIPIDFSNKDRSNIKYHFGKVSKIQYRNGKKLSPQTVYKSIIPTEKMPTIVSTKGNNISDIKKYFTTAEIVALISGKSNIEYEELISGKYKLLLEPMVYVTYGGSKWAMTSHEAALYNEKTNNDIVMKFNSITHRSLPFSMFLEVSDLGFPAYKGATNKATKDHVIKDRLGLGIVRFNGVDPSVPVKPKPTPEEKPPTPNIDVDTKSYDYRVNTDVISSIEIKATNKVTPKNPISVTFNVLGKKHTVDNIVIPEGSSQLVWVKWHTPSTPQTVNIDVSIKNANVNSAKIKAVVDELKEITPPNPIADDRNDKFKMPNLPNNNNVISSTWSKWSCKWKEDMKWVVYGEDEKGNDIGEWVDKGDWEYSITNYSADLSANMELTPGIRTPQSTWSQKGSDYEMKSGYGVNTKINTSVTHNASSNDITSAQNIIDTFSDFKYEKYNRILEKTVNNGLKSQFEFKKNKYSTYTDRTHFTPIWYPDNMNYIVNAEIIDIWTPTGMLKVNLSDKVQINSDLHKDRHIGIMK